MRNRWRLLAAILLLTLSLALLAWSYWPVERIDQSLPIDPSIFTLPTPVSFLLLGAF